MTTIFRPHSVRAQFFRFLLLAFCLSAHAAQAEDIQSPHRNLTRHFALVADGEPTHSLNYKGRPGIKTSRLGLDLKVGPGLASGFGAASSSTSTFDERWNPVWGGVKTIRNHYNQLTVTLIQAATKRTMLLHFRLFDDGLGLRYAFSKQPNDHPAVQPADPRADGLYARNFRNPDRRLQPEEQIICAQRAGVPAGPVRGHVLAAADGADLPETYEKYLDAFQIIEDVAVDWDDTRGLEAGPGDYIAIARKAKGQSSWFLGARATSTGGSRISIWASSILARITLPRSMRIARMRTMKPIRKLTPSARWR